MPRPREAGIHRREEDAAPGEGRETESENEDEGRREEPREERHDVLQRVLQASWLQGADSHGQRHDDGGPERDRGRHDGGRRPQAGGAQHGRGPVADSQGPQDEREEPAQREADGRADGERPEEDDHRGDDREERVAELEDGVSDPCAQVLPHHGPPFVLLACAPGACQRERRNGFSRSYVRARASRRSSASSAVASRVWATNVATFPR